MPAQSKAQQKAAGAALAAKRDKDKDKVDSLQGASRDMYDSMTEKELEEMAATPRKDLPRKKEGSSD